MFKRLLNLPLDQQASIFLFGPRGTGKTSWLRQHVTDSIYLDLLDFSTYSDLSSYPSKLQTFIPPHFSGWIIIDEIQRIPELLNTVHKLIEEKKYRFILTGSSARTLRRQGVNLLAGRALRYVMHPLIVDEVGVQFDLGFSLQYGMLPSIFEHHDPKKYLESYVQTYLREEVLQEGLTRNIGSFTRFLETASFSQGQILNMSEIARELSLNRLTVTNYFDILDDLLLSHRLSVFTHKAKRKMIAHQKFYFFDVGVYQTIRPTGPLDGREIKEGVALETLFLQSLLAINDYYHLGYSIYFWRTLSGDEVDFVLYGEKGFYAFEIKRTDNIHGSMFKGLRKFYEDYPESKLYFISLSKHKEYHGAITAIPFVEALQNLKTILTT
jgi:uncharacterized protein